jgi:LemA protein
LYYPKEHFFGSGAMVIWVVLGVVALLVMYVIGAYNSLVSLRNLGQEGWSGIDVQLKRRADLIPNLMETVKGYMSHERETLEAVTAMRAKVLQAAASGNVAERIKAEGMLSGALTTMMGVVENYPDLKANTGFLDFQRNLASIEEELQMSRRYYNGAARNLNIKIESFPSNLIAQKFAFEKLPFFEIENEADRANPKVSFS